MDTTELEIEPETKRVVIRKVMRWVFEDLGDSKL